MIDAGVIPDKPIKKLILTHCHFDHILYAAEIKEKYGAKIYASKKCSLNLKKREIVDPFFDGKFPKLDVDVIIKEGDLIEGLKVIETPGHTDCSICLFDEKEKFLFSGDTLFNEGIGRTDLPTGDENKILKSLERLNKLNPRRIFPGH